ncbi:beta-ketoacyl-[acyl-carrier-protein] synthase family protein [Thalassococcus sp. CAU 1522]|uniref:Beta-ketoacyl-[acyl-carrier-protein] synthase family protein n=1 Tax=Thalassococcus arenae TaxID=2851652 RepID=A0ABS6N2C9_9RHOB|nr:beta-ketoacyl-[acyl-carrier-protein] synthase family protein [Thalassococcus arenae]MBV2358173.1 beta-ketoacyl-[acyl-carrier-protein] synthase family protein [Thalassococcus arenae]
MTRSVVVTGLGVVTRDAACLAEFQQLLDRGGSEPDAPKQFDTERFRARRAHATDPDTTRAALYTALSAGRLPPLEEPEIACAGHGLLAALEAIDQAGLASSPRTGMGCAVATTSGGLMDRFSDALDDNRRGDGALVTPASTAQVLSRVFGLSGPVCAFSCACMSSLAALSYAMARITSGDADIMLVGGSDRMREADFAGFNALRAMDRDRCRPFDKTRRGMMIGDGAAMLVIEDEHHARARGARPLVRLEGIGLSLDSHHITSPDSRGLVRAMQQALALTGRRPNEIGYVNCHGTGTPLNDAAEADALNQVFPAGVPRPVVSSTKGATGHLLGTAGAIETVATILALAKGDTPVMATTREPEDIGFRLPVLQSDGRISGEVAMKNSLGFGGLNGSLILERLEMGEP